MKEIEMTKPIVTIPTRSVATHFATPNGPSTQPTGEPGEYVSKVKIVEVNPITHTPVTGRALCTFTRYSEDGAWHIGGESGHIPFAQALFGMPGIHTLSQLRNAVALAVGTYRDEAEPDSHYGAYDRASERIRAHYSKSHETA